MNKLDSSMSKTTTKLFIAIFAGLAAFFVALMLFVIVRTVRQGGEMDVITLLMIAYVAGGSGWLVVKNMKYGRARGYWL